MVLDVISKFAKKGRQMGRMATLTRVFQILRVVVNEKVTVLEEALLGIALYLMRRWRKIAVLRYHSLEDRAAKLSMRDSAIIQTKEAYGK